MNTNERQRGGGVLMRSERYGTHNASTRRYRDSMCLQSDRFTRKWNNITDFRVKLSENSVILLDCNYNIYDKLAYQYIYYITIP